MSTTSLSESLGRWSTGDQNDLLTCDVCLEPYDERVHEAKFLSCHHTFCATCLGTLSGSQTVIECPACRTTTDLSEGGIGALQTNFYITYMQEILSRLGSPKVKGCQKHSNQPLSFFCKTCAAPICRDCIVIDHQGKNHDVQDVQDAETEQRRGLDNEIREGKSAVDSIHSKMQALEAETSSLNIIQEKMKEHIESAFEKYVTILQRRKIQLLHDVDRKVQDKLAYIDVQKEEIQKLKNNMATSVDYCEKLVKRGALSEVVLNMTSLKETTKNIKQLISNISVGLGYMQFNAEANIDNMISAVNEVGDIKIDQALPASLIIRNHSNVTASLPSSFTLLVADFNDKLLKSYPIGIKVIDPSNTNINCEQHEDQEAGGLWHVTFLPQMAGEHKVVVSFLGQPIKNIELPLIVKCNTPVLKFGAYGNGNGKFNCPRAVALDKEGYVYIADTGNRLIQKIDRDGDFIKQFKIDGGNEECSTCDLAINKGQGWIICTETHVGMNINPTMGSTVAIYDTEGQLKQKFQNKSMKCALCVASNKHSEIVISDYLVHSLFMYNENGIFLRKIGHAGMFNHPAFIAIDSDDHIIVSDTNNDCIQVFDREGKFLYQFGSHGTNKGQLRQPFGVATDNIYIIVVDSGNQRVQVFKKDGTFVSMIESRDEPFSQPRGITVTDDGYFLVADRDNHCIKKYRYK